MGDPGERADPERPKPSLTLTFSLFRALALYCNIGQLNLRLAIKLFIIRHHAQLQPERDSLDCLANGWFVCFTMCLFDAPEQRKRQIGFKMCRSY